MSRVLVAPSAGHPISASFFAELLREIRANRPLPGKNTSTERTPNGTHISAVAAEQRSSKAVKDVGCFAIQLKEKENPSDEDEYVFKHPYYRVGGKTYRVGDADETTAYMDENTITALKVSMADSEPNATLESYASYEALRAAENDETSIVVPLYRFGSKQSESQKVPPVICDFRLGMPSISAEFGEVNA